MRKRTLKLPKIEVPATPQTLIGHETEDEFDALLKSAEIGETPKSAETPPDLEDGLPEAGVGGATTFEDWLKTPEGRRAVDPRFPTHSLSRVEGHLIEILRLAWNRGAGL